MMYLSLVCHRVYANRDSKFPVEYQTESAYHKCDWQMSSGNEWGRPERTVHLTTSHSSLRDVQSYKILLSNLIAEQRNWKEQ